jgi:hypothetical protein
MAVWHAPGRRAAIRWIAEQWAYHAHESRVEFDPRRIRGVLLGILVRRVSGDFGGDVVLDAFRHAVGVREERPELLVECLQDIAQPVQFWFRLAAGTRCPASPSGPARPASARPYPERTRLADCRVGEPQFRLTASLP